LDLQERIGQLTHVTSKSSIFSSPNIGRLAKFKRLCQVVRACRWEERDKTFREEGKKTTLGSTVRGIRVKNRTEASSFIVLQASGLSGWRIRSLQARILTQNPGQTSVACIHRAEFVRRPWVWATVITVVTDMARRSVRDKHWKLLSLVLYILSPVGNLFWGFQHRLYTFP